MRTAVALTRTQTMSTAFYTHTDCRGHDMGPGHPECPQRLDAIEDHLLATGLDIALHRPDEVPLARHEDLMLAIGKSYLVFNKIDSLEAIFNKIESIDANHLTAIANEVFDPSKLSTLIYQ